MIDALIYGMMPSAKIVICDRFLPENMSYRPNIVFLAWSTSTRQRRGIDPRRRDVTADTVDGEQTEREEHTLPEIRDRKDVLEAFEHDTLLTSAFAVLRQHLCLAARSGNLFRRRAAELVRVHRQGLRDIAAAKHLDAPGAADEPVLAEEFNA